MSVKVIGWELHKDGHCEYITEVTREESGMLPRVHWQFRQRWSKFEALGREFYSEMYPISYRTNTSIPTCKHESYLGKTASSVLGMVTSYWAEDSDEFRNKRQQDLETFLQACLAFPEGETSVCLLKFLQVVPEELDSLRRLLATANLEREEARSMATHALQDRAAKLEAKLTAVEARQRVESAELLTQKASENEQRIQLEEHRLQIAELEQQLTQTRNELALTKAKEAEPADPVLPQSTTRAPELAPEPEPEPAPEPAPEPPPALQETSHKQAWRQLVAMGFNSVLASTVLSKVDGDVEKAMEELLSVA